MPTSSLTDQYIAVTLRSLSEQHRARAEKDLRATIAADLTRRIGQGAEPGTAEYRVLESLGDPAELATHYAHGQRTLIGHRLFSSWSLASRWTCATVLPCVYLVLVIVYAVNQDNVWITIFRPIGITMTVGVYLLAAITAGYGLYERQLASVTPAARWSPDRLRHAPGGDE